MSKKILSSGFIGKQLSRLKMGQTYYAIAVSTISTISLIVIAFEFEIWILLMLFPILLFSAFLVGYYMDKKDIITKDILRTNNMYYRYLSTSDFKLQEFQLLLVRSILKSFQDIKDNKNINMNYLMEEYEKYRKNWEPIV